MKNLILFLIVCGLIFAACPIAFNLESNTAYASIDWRKYLPKPIIIPPTDTLITPTLPEKLETLKEPAALKNIASIDWRKYLPKPIIIPPTDTLITPTLPEKLETLKEPAALKNIASIDWRKYLPKPIIIPLPEPDSASANINLASI
jgi:hypothetical protein